MKPSPEAVDTDARVLESNDRGAVVALRWRPPGSSETRSRYQALRWRDGLIVEIEGFRRARDARKAVGLP
jgi:hypothetical protein